MKRNGTDGRNQVLYVGIDLHKVTWHLTGILENGSEVFSISIRAEAVELLRYLERWRHMRIEAVYEAGYFGYWLHDELEAHGIRCIVTPPSLIPGEYGNRVKTDRRDSRKLAMYCAKGLLKRVHVLTPEERCHRQVLRTRRQLIADRKRKQCQIKALCALYGMPLPDTSGPWTRTFVASLHRIRFADIWLQKCFDQLMSAFDSVDRQVQEQTDLIRELAQDEKYRERVALLKRIPGIGLLTAMELLLELQDVARFRTGDELAAYVGLTPSQYSSGEHVRMGHITRIGKPDLRRALIEAAWVYVRKDKRAAETYANIRNRAGGKRAIVAMARRMLLLSRSVLINRTAFVPAA
jgi:transposase